ncbi:MAG: hypothetical protein EPO07_03810 [Verrucomicrobia bacterium]|nr:MAG: hypothetical protein EPO07_03810 [Verrucomicrobiota bacterium]
MKILLQHLRTRLFLRNAGTWTDKVEEAHDFQHSQRVIDFVRQQQLEGVQIMVKFAEPQFDEVFPIPPVTSGFASARA